MSNIHGLGSVPKQTDDKKNEFFTSQGKTSGTGVIRPKDRGNPQDIIDQARANSGAAPSGSGGPPAAVITLYANGFQIEGGEFRDSSQPENQRFLDELRSGVVPQELEQDLRATLDPNVREVAVALKDLSQQRYEAPPPKFDFAKSQGRTLGSTSASSSSSGTDGLFRGAVPTEAKVDASKPTTTIQIVTPDRKKLRVTFNHDHRAVDVYQHIQYAGGINGPFAMVAGFPPKTVTNPNATLKEAGLVGASIQVKAL